MIRFTAAFGPHAKQSLPAVIILFHATTQRKREGL